MEEKAFRGSEGYLRRSCTGSTSLRSTQDCRFDSLTMPSTIFTAEIDSNRLSPQKCPTKGPSFIPHFPTTIHLYNHLSHHISPLTSVTLLGALSGDHAFSHLNVSEVSQDLFSNERMQEAQITRTHYSHSLTISSATIWVTVREPGNTYKVSTLMANVLCYASSKTPPGYPSFRPGKMLTAFFPWVSF